MGKCHFRSDWLEKTDNLGLKLSKWAKQGKSDSELFCVVCSISVNVSKGYQAVTQHYTGKKHIKNVQTKVGNAQCRLVVDNRNVIVNPETSAATTLLVLDPSVPSSHHPSSKTGVSDLSANSQPLLPVLVGQDQVCHSPVPSSGGHLRFYSPRDAATRAEIIWSMTMLAKNLSAQSCQDISAIFSAMFPGSIPEGFSLSPKKFSYVVTDALGPYFRDLMLKDASKEFFSLQFDETTNNKGKKELQISLKFWSNFRDEIVTHHLETIFIGSAKAEVLSVSILSAVTNGSLSLRNLITVGSDGPVVNKKVFRLLNEEVTALRGKHLLSVGTCNLHHVNNAFLKGLEAFGSDVSELVISVYYFFHGWPSRQEDYATCQKLENIPQHSFIKHTTTRWLTLKEAACRLLEQWSAVRHYFLKFLPLQKSPSNISSYHKIVSLLKKRTMKAELHFIVSSSEMFVKFSVLFQKEEPLIHVLQSEIDTLLLTVMGRVCKKDSLIDQQQISENAFNSENLLSVKEVECGQLVHDELLKLSERDQLEFRLGVQKHYVACGKYLLSKSDKMMKLFKCLQPSKIKDVESCQSIADIARALPGEINVDILLDEWRLLRTEHDVVNFSPGLRIDHFWRNIFKILNSVGAVKYPTVQKVVKMSLSIYHGSADVERGFSLSARILTEERASMNERTLNARLNVIDGLRLFKNNPVEVPITKELLQCTQTAHKSYVQYCNLKKEKEEKERISKENEKQQAAAEEENKRKAKRIKIDIETLRSDLREAEKQYRLKKETREKLFDEANTRLKAALLKTDFKEVNLAQAMMEGVETIKGEEELLQRKVARLQKAVDCKTSTFISDFVKKM